MDERIDAIQIRLRLIEAAAKHPHSTHKDGHAVGVLAAADLWYTWVTGETFTVAPHGGPAPETMREKLGLPKKR